MQLKRGIATSAITNIRILKHVFSWALKITRSRALAHAHQKCLIVIQFCMRPIATLSRLGDL